MVAINKNQTKSKNGDHRCDAYTLIVLLLKMRAVIVAIFLIKQNHTLVTVDVIVTPLMFSLVAVEMVRVGL